MNIKLIIGVAAIMLSLTTFSQATRGKVFYDVYISSDNPAASAYIDKMEGSMLELSFIDGKIRSDLFIGEMNTNTSINHKNQDTVLILIDGMVGKIAMKVTESEMDDEQRMAFENVEVELIDETKEIMGYTCKKAIVTKGDAQESIVWYTEEILPSYRTGQYLFEDIPGVPLEMYSKWWKMDLKIVAYDFKEKIKKADQVFSLKVPEGFTVKTAEEMKRLGR